jgi:hypothetical protein
VTWAHVLTGVADLGLTAVHQESLLKIFRNAHYQQLDQTISAFHRISGIMPEPSNYAAYGLVMLAIMGEMWMRGVAARATGLAALAMLVILLLTTSTTAYLGVAFYGFTLLFRILFMPGASETSKSAVVGILFLAFAGMAIGAMLFRPDFARKALDVLSYTTVAKGSTGSGSERALWAREGLQAFVFTHGLGVGVGSFRSSGLFAAAIGSVGLIGLLLLVGYLFQVVRPLSASTYRARVPAPLGAGVAASWAVLMSIVAASSTSATPDPGALCGVLAGLALVWRAPRASPRRERLGAPAGVVWSTGPGGAAPLAEREWFP